MANRQPVQSSHIRAIGYEDATQTLEVELLNGSVYRYPNVRPELHAQLLRAPSIGRHFRTHVHGKFGHEMTTPPKGRRA